MVVGDRSPSGSSGGGHRKTMSVPSASPPSGGRRGGRCLGGPGGGPLHPLVGDAHLPLARRLVRVDEPVLADHHRRQCERRHLEVVDDAQVPEPGRRPRARSGAGTRSVPAPRAGRTGPGPPRLLPRVRRPTRARTSPRCPPPPACPPRRRRGCASSRRPRRSCLPPRSAVRPDRTCSTVAAPPPAVAGEVRAVLPQPVADRVGVPRVTSVRRDTSPGSGAPSAR